MNWTMEPPSRPGTYWFRRDPPPRDLMGASAEDQWGIHRLVA